MLNTTTDFAMAQKEGSCVQVNEYKEPTILEQLNNEKTNLIQRLSEICELEKIILDKPELEGTIKKFRGRFY